MSEPAVAAAMATSFAAAVPGLLAIEPERWLTVAAAEWERVRQVMDAGLAQGLRHAPALTIGLAALIAVPTLAVLGVVMRAALGRRPRSVAPQSGEGVTVDTASPAVRHGAAAEGTPPRTPNGTGAATGAAKSAGTGAWLIALDASVPPRRLARQVRIGREVDNDLALALPTVHRYHAFIERTAEGHFAIHDLGGPDGNGVFVNGRRCEHAALRDGDVVALGAAQFTFADREATREAAERRRHEPGAAVPPNAPGDEVEITSDGLTRKAGPPRTL